MARIGFHASHEMSPPSQLLRHMQAAERCGFEMGMCSDHFHPWSERQGESGYAWSWLGAALQATSFTFGTVCAPGQRYHPAVIAQAAATLAEMFPGRFWIAVGSGELLNESITGDPWPSKPDRNQRLKESVDIMRRLWAGELVAHKGLVQVRDAKLYTLPKQPPKVVGAALTEVTARWMGSWVDALITAGSEPASLAKVIAAFREGGGQGKPIALQVALSFAKTHEKALEQAHTYWRQAGLEPTQLADLRTPRQFDQATKSVRPEDLRDTLRISADPSQHAAWLQEYIGLGFDEIYLHQLARDQAEFLEVFSSRVLPQLR